jgi:hypothetical protein
MKNFMRCFFIFSWLLVFSCSDTSMVDEFSSYDALLSAKEFSPANTTNPYDSLGLVYYSLYDRYYSSGHIPSTITAVVDTLNMMVAKDSIFHLIAPLSYQYSGVHEVDALLNCNVSCQDGLLASYFSSPQAQADFIDFLDDYETRCLGSSTFGDLYDYVVDYEDFVQHDTILTVGEKRLLLIATSIARYTAYAKKKKPKKNTDPEWALLVTNLYGAMDGATRTDADAVMEALVVGIMRNK